MPREEPRQPDSPPGAKKRWTSTFEANLEVTPAHADR
jgi:hypothetical protein